MNDDDGRSRRAATVGSVPGDVRVSSNGPREREREVGDPTRDRSINRGSPGANSCFGMSIRTQCRRDSFLRSEHMYVACLFVLYLDARKHQALLVIFREVPFLSLSLVVSLLERADAVM